MSATMTTQTENRKIHPQKFAMWVAIGSIIMMFGGFTSGFIVRKGQGSWIDYTLPWEFIVSTIVILASSYTMHRAVVTFRKRQMPLHKTMVTATCVLGIAFVVLQYFGFHTLSKDLDWSNWQNNVGLQFLAVIIGVHVLHLIGGVVALIILYARTFSRRTKIFSPVGIEIVATYWHFVDILWVYLFVFFWLNQ